MTQRACAALASVAAVLLSGCTGDAEPAEPPPAVTVTVTVAVTSTVRVPAAPSEPTPYQRTPAPDAQRWAVRTPAGMVCGFDAMEITCRGDYDSGATALRWRVGAPAAEPVDVAVTVPEDGQAEPHDFLPSMASGSRESFYFEVDGNALASQQVSGQEFR